MNVSAVSDEVKMEMQIVMLVGEVLWNVSVI